MPLYEYLCESCGRTVEVIQSVGEPPLSLCDRCGGRLKKLLSLSAVQFKGTGWYVSDYGRSGSASSKSGEGAGTAGATGEGSAPKEAPKGDVPKKDA